MLGLMIHWELPFDVAVNNGAARKYLKVWTHTAKAFGVTDLFVVDLDGSCPKLQDGEINITYHQTDEEVLENYTDIQHIYVDRGGKNIYSFEHPEEAIYVIGSDYKKFNKPADATIIGFKSERVTHAFIAAGIILASR